jgi:hypothetical protein
MIDLTDTDPAWMQDDDAREYASDDEEPTITAEQLGEALRNAMPGLVEQVSEGGVIQRSDEELIVWGGYGFRIHLSDGTTIEIQLHQRYGG